CYQYFFFFFQAEDGIRDRTVTGVQTCALPIYSRSVCGPHAPAGIDILRRRLSCPCCACRSSLRRSCEERCECMQKGRGYRQDWRSEERRVGKECRCRWWPHQCKKRGSV